MTFVKKTLIFILKPGKLSLVILALVVSYTNGYSNNLRLTPDSTYLPKKQKRFIAFPVIVKSPELSWGLGAATSYYFKAKKNDPMLRTSNIQTLALYTLRKQRVLGVDGVIYFPHENYILKLHGSTSIFPDRFWGIGNTTKRESLEKYSISQFYFFPTILRKIYRKLYTGIGYEFQRVYQFEYQQGGQSIFDIQNVSGRHGGQISGGGFLIAWDSRNHAFSSSKGLYVQYYLSNFYQKLGSDFFYKSQSIDIRKYFDLYKDRVIAIQFVSIFQKGDVPIRSMANIGSAMIMRGYYEGRYTDKNLAAIQAEYRTPLFRRFGAVCFAGAGKVNGLLNELWKVRPIHPSYGAGIRYSLNKVEKLNLRLDLGFGERHEHGLYLNLAESF